jgi:hypothetical protein
MAPAPSSSPPSSLHPVRVAICVGLQASQVAHPPPRFRRSLAHQRRRNKRLPRGRSEPLRRRLFGIFLAPLLPAFGRPQIPPELWESLSGPLQVCSFPLLNLSYSHSSCEILCSPSGRGTPDISAQGVNFPIFLNGDEQIVSGTSGSAPVRLTLPLLPVSILEHPANFQCTDRGRHYLAAQ